MFNFSQGTAQHQSAAARNLFAGDGHVHFVSCGEGRRDGEIVFPMFDPVLRIAPMALGGMSDLGQCGGLIWLSTVNLNVHAHRSLTLSWSDNRVLIRPLPGGEGRGEGLSGATPLFSFPLPSRASETKEKSFSAVLAYRPHPSPLPRGEGTPDRNRNVLPSSLRCRMLPPKIQAKHGTHSLSRTQHGSGNLSPAGFRSRMDRVRRESSGPSRGTSSRRDHSDQQQAGVARTRFSALARTEVDCDCGDGL